MGELAETQAGRDRLPSYMKVLGVERVYRQIVEEPEPGRIIIERDLETGLETRFTLEPLQEAGQTRVTITTHPQVRSGVMGLVEGMMTRLFLKRIFKQELGNLRAYLSVDEPMPRSA